MAAPDARGAHRARRIRTAEAAGHRELLGRRGARRLHCRRRDSDRARVALPHEGRGPRDVDVAGARARSRVAGAQVSHRAAGGLGLRARHRDGRSRTTSTASARSRSRPGERFACSWRRRARSPPASTSSTSRRTLSRRFSRASPGGTTSTRSPSGRRRRLQPLGRSGVGAAGHPARRSHHRRGDHDAGERHPPRARGRRRRGPLPHRRRAARHDDAAARRGPAAGVAHQDHGADGHRRSPASAGRSRARVRQRESRRPSRFDAAGVVRREGRHPNSRQPLDGAVARRSWDFLPTKRSGSTIW